MSEHPKRTDREPDNSDIVELIKEFGDEVAEPILTWLQKRELIKHF
jgi:hypothetical protein